MSAPAMLRSGSTLVLVLATLLATQACDEAPSDPDGATPGEDSGTPPDVDAGPGEDSGTMDVDAGPMGMVLDGIASEPEWEAAARAVNTTASSWGDGNQLTELRAMRHEDGNLYIYIQGALDTASNNTWVVFVDGDIRGTRGVDGAMFADNDGEIDDPISLASLDTIDEALVDLVWATKDLERMTVQGNDPRTGWRNPVPDPTNFATVDDAWTSCTLTSCEMVVPLATLGTMDGDTIAIAARLTNDNGEFISNQTLPESMPDDPTYVVGWLEF